MEKNKFVLVTGCSSGIGKAISKRFISKNWEVIGVDKQSQPEDLNISQFIQLDLSDENSSERIKEKIDSGPGRLDCLINNAAVQICKPFTEIDQSEWDQSFTVNVRAPFFLVQELFPHLKKDQGSIINISSVHTIATSSDISVYASTKGAISALTRALAIECGKYDVRVNAILPGAVDTPMLREGLKRNEIKSKNERANLKNFTQKHVLGRIGVPDDIAKLSYFLADHQQSSFITGQSFVIDGGATIKLSTE